LNQTLANGERLFDAVRQTRNNRGLEVEPVDDHLNRVFGLATERRRVFGVDDLAIDPNPDIAHRLDLIQSCS
jgi:hypothetical protein